MGTLLSFNQKSQMKYSDQRVKLLNEMLHGIKVMLQLMNCEICFSCVLLAFELLRQVIKKKIGIFE